MLHIMVLRMTVLLVSLFQSQEATIQNHQSISFVTTFLLKIFHFA